jgi:hypothetical protein
VDKLDYAFALVSLTDPKVSGSRAAALKLISKPEDLRTIAADTPASARCRKASAARAAQRRVIVRLTPHRVRQGRDVITFLTWSSAGGVVYRNTVVLARGGVVSSNVPLAAHRAPTKTDQRLGPTPARCGVLREARPRGAGLADRVERLANSRRGLRSRNVDTFHLEDDVAADEERFVADVARRFRTARSSRPGSLGRPAARSARLRQLEDARHSPSSA